LSRQLHWPPRWAAFALRKVHVQAQALARENNWDIERAENFLICKELDPDIAALPTGVHVHSTYCGECQSLFFFGLDKKGIVVSDSTRWCPRCLDGADVVFCPRCDADLLREPNTGICLECIDEIVIKND
jgi:hypothetical protein